MSNATVRKESIVNSMLSECSALIEVADVDSHQYKLIRQAEVALMTLKKSLIEEREDGEQLAEKTTMP